MIRFGEPVTRWGGMLLLLILTAGIIHRVGADSTSTLYFPIVEYQAPTPTPTSTVTRTPTATPTPTPTRTPTPTKDPGTPPRYSTSLYMKTINPLTLYSLGCVHGVRDMNLAGAQDSIVVLAFGRPTMSNEGIYGASLFGFGPASTTEIAEAVQQFGAGYVACSLEDTESRLRIGAGTSNYGDPVAISWWDHGRKWARMVNDINTWFSNQGLRTRVDAVGANDIELAWNNPTVTRAWVDGYDYANKYPYYDFGAVEGCPTRLAPNWSCSSPWTKNDVWYVSYGAGPAYPLPLIYATTGVNARQWAWMSVYAVEQKGARMEFVGAFTQYQACQQRGGCTGLDNEPDEGWQQLYNELKYDPRTAQTLRWSTDIKWWGE